METNEPAKKLFQQWLDQRILDGHEPDPASLCEDAPDLLPDLMALVEQFQALLK